MKQQETFNYQEIYRKLLVLEKGIQELKALLLNFWLSGGVVCRHPISLEGIWAGANISDEDLAAARKAMFPIKGGLFIPKELFGDFSDLEINISPDRVITIRSITRNRKEICCSMDARREKLREQYGLMDDSSKIIREFRDSR